MFEELDLKISDATKSQIILPHQTFNTCSKAICSETSGKYCW